MKDLSLFTNSEHLGLTKKEVNSLALSLGVCALHCSTALHHPLLTAQQVNNENGQNIYTLPIFILISSLGILTEIHILQMLLEPFWLGKLLSLIPLHTF